MTPKQLHIIFNYVNEEYWSLDRNNNLAEEPSYYDLKRFWYGKIIQDCDRMA